MCVLECAAEAEAVLAPLLARMRAGAVRPPVVGLDAEWVLSRPVSLLQLSVGLDCCLLLRLHRMAPRLPPSLAALLADASIVKTGVGVGADLRLLHEQFGALPPFPRRTPHSCSPSPRPCPTRLSHARAVACHLS